MLVIPTYFSYFILKKKNKNIKIFKRLTEYLIILNNYDIKYRNRTNEANIKKKSELIENAIIYL